MKCEIILRSTVDCVTGGAGDDGGCIALFGGWALDLDCGGSGGGGRGGGSDGTVDNAGENTSALSFTFSSFPTSSVFSSLGTALSVASDLVIHALASLRLVVDSS